MHSSGGEGGFHYKDPSMQYNRAPVGLFAKRKRGTWLGDESMVN
jgi:hypothetical protein